MISIILAIGQESSIRPPSYFIPKILLPVRGQRLLDYPLENMKNIYIEHYYIVVPEHAEAIETYLKKTSKKKTGKVRGLGWEPGGDFATAFERIWNRSDSIVMNGDILTDVDLSQLYHFYREYIPLVCIPLFDLTDSKEAIEFCNIKPADVLSITEFGEIYNVGNDKKVTVLDLAGMIFEVTKSTFEIDFILLPLFDPKRRMEDISKLRSLGFAHEASFVKDIEMKDNENASNNI